ncbi:MAG TPA: zf-HC2 domain-containing protein [Polyangiaceae bacterium]|nr:zf-HC2 domain-containing protein [Polyangiaceae bacterium]
MDCEKFDRIVLDLLYGELDELTDAAARRHIEHCARCKAVSAGLRATREVGTLPLVDPPEGLELGILEAERQANARLPLRKKLGRGVSILAVYAMRPQLAMAALLLLMIGSSLFFLRGQPGARDSVLVTERGTPEAEEHVAILPAPERRATPAATAAPKAANAKGDAAASRERSDEKRDAEEAPAAAAPAAAEPQKEAAPQAEGPAAATTPADSLDAASAAFQGGRYVEAQRRFEEIAAHGGADAAVAALQAVEALRRQGGCPAAAPRYEEVHSRYRDTPSGSEAAWQAGDCYRALGELSRARQNLEALLEVAEYRSRAETALDDLNTREQQVAAARKAKAAPPAAAAPAEAKPAPAKAAKPQAKPNTAESAQ